MESEHQLGFSNTNLAMFDENNRVVKSKKIVSVIKDFYNSRLEDLIVLDVGCSAGIISTNLSKKFRFVFGVDIDKSALEFGKKEGSNNDFFSLQDGMLLGFKDDSFDAVICNHVYEHVADSKKLMAEIYRVLKSDGVCYFGANNRIMLVEPHYGISLLSVVPKFIANIILKFFGRGNYYYEKHLTLWGLRNLVEKFRIVDYTEKIVRDPVKYNATEMVKQGSMKQKMGILMIKIAYWLFPGYVWMLKKEIS